MTSDRAKRFREQRQKLNRMREEQGEPASASVVERLVPVATPAEGDMFARVDARYQSLAAAISAPVEFDPAEADQLLESIRSRWDKHQFDGMLSSCSSQVLRSVLGPFGLGGIVGLGDKDGGNVTTVHNAKKGVFANDDDRRRYGVEGDYRRADYDKDFKPKRKVAMEAARQSGEPLRDVYTGEVLPRDGNAEYDHVVSAKEVHDDPLRRLTMEVDERARVANKDENLDFTNSRLNQSKGEHSLEEWMKKSKDGENNVKRFGVDKERTLQRDKVARDSLRKETYIAAGKKYAVELTTTGAQEAAKMGVQQAFGLVLAEFFSATFEQITDAYQNGFRDSLAGEGFFDALKRRLLAIATRVAGKWQGVVQAFADGALSGFLSNLATFIINQLITTSKRIVRVIREGFFSILRAIKTALFPPEGLSREEAYDAALKLLATGVVTGLGVMAEEVVEKGVTAFLTSTLPLLAPIGGMIAAVVTGALVAIASSLLVFAIDKLDLFGVQGKKKHSFVIQELDRMLEASSTAIEDMYAELMNPLHASRPATT